MNNRERKKARDNDYLYLLATRLEFENLCRRIVCDGRDPDFVAFALTQKVSDSLRYYRQLWEARDE